MPEGQDTKDKGYLNLDELPLLRVRIKVSDTEENEEIEKLKERGVAVSEKKTTRFETAALDVRTLYFIYRNEDKDNGGPATTLEFKNTEERLTVYHSFDEIFNAWLTWSKRRKSKRLSES